VNRIDPKPDTVSKQTISDNVSTLLDDALASQRTPVPANNFLNHERAVFHAIHHNNRRKCAITAFGASLVD
jgi:hypothetical protein